MMKGRSFAVCILAAMMLQGCADGSSYETDEASHDTEVTEDTTVDAANTEDTEDAADTTVDMEDTSENAAAGTEDMDSSEEYVYDKDAWLSPDGSIDYPFDQKELLYSSLTDEEKAARYVIPQEALDEAASADLIKLCCNYILANSYIIFEQPGDFLAVFENELNVLQEVTERDDYAEALLEVYQNLQFMPAQSFDDKEEQKAYNEEAYMKDGGITLCEILLASDEAFEKMTDDMRHKVMEEVARKLERREDDRYVCADARFGFFAYIAELKDENGCSRWYEYLKETDSEYMTYIDALTVGN